jgi:glycosyltransferase involved in cell wall biosynthesis|tara:strand:- start:46 stop:621 length:576 start_codon:yes stop_codon:yes gene_type:complete
MMFTPDPFLIESMGWKRNDLLLRGFAMALGQGVSARLVLVARAGSPDEDKARRLLDGLGVSDHVDWLTPENPEGYTWREVADLYRHSDVIVDEFGGCLGLVALEGASCGKPVLNYLDSTYGDGVVESLYPGGHPFLQAQSAEDICNVIMELTDQELRMSIGRASRQWVMDHHERNLVARRCVSMLEEMLAS